MTGQQLKNSILQMAVQGKLVPQDPNDEPASVLLERIRKEKEQLIKEGKIKKDKNPSYIFRGADNLPYEKVGNNEPVCIADEVPFDIPDSWEWIRLGSVLSVISDGTHKTPHYVSDGVPFLSVQNISSGKFDLTKIKYITEEEHQKLIERIKPQRNDILFCRIGTLGKAIKCTLDFEFSIFVSLGLLRAVDISIIDYLIFAINSPLGDKWIQDNKVGGGTHTYKINLIDIPRMLIPIPPLKEQKRIFDRLSIFEPLIEEYTIKENTLSLLDKSFGDYLKKSILQEAVQGNLVSQDENDEPASVLLERIREEKARLVKEGKIKKDKNESVIFRRDNSHYEKLNGIERCIDDEIPFDIPENWHWCRLGTISTYAQTKEKINAQNASSETWGLDLEDIERGGKILNKVMVGERKAVGDKTIFYKGDILYSKLRPYLLKILVADNNGICTPEIVPFNTYGNIYNEFIAMYLKSPYVDNLINAITYGVKMPRVGTETMVNLLVPLPPLIEQHRIVSTYDSLVPYTEQL